MTKINGFSRSGILQGMVFVWLAATMAISSAQTATVSYSLDNVVQENGQQMTGVFKWAYTEGDFENGSGVFTELFIPGHGTDIGALTINFDIKKSIEFSLTANIHGGGVNVTLFLASPLTPVQPALIDLSRSSYEIERGGSKGGFISGNISPGAMPIPAVDIEKLTNGNQADGANDSDVPGIAPGEMVTWTYDVTNSGGVAIAEAELAVTDSQPGITPVLNVATDDGDMILSPGEKWSYVATAQAVDLTTPPAGVKIVPGCNDTRNTYENTGRVDIAGTEVFDEDLSHYCNPSDLDDDGISDPEDNCVLVPNGPLIPDAGGNSQRDTDGDGYGNLCDADFDGSLNVDFSDLAFLKSKFFTNNPDADLDGNGTVDFGDLAILKSGFFSLPGPSGLVP